MKQALRNSCIAAAGVMLLAACGGSSDDDSGGLTGGTPAAEPATITAQNAPMIAGTVAEVAMGQGVFSSIFTPDIPIAATGKDAAVSPILSAAMKSAAPSQLYATSASLENCAVSGTVDVQVIVDNPLEPAAIPLSVNLAFHHANHALVLADQADEIGLENVAYMRALMIEDPSGESALDFALRQFGQ